MQNKDIEELIEILKKEKIENKKNKNIFQIMEKKNDEEECNIACVCATTNCTCNIDCSCDLVCQCEYN